jgi:hypothetical protein
MGFSFPDRYRCAAVIVPGLFAGFLIWGIILATDAYLNIGTRADRFAFVAFIVAPVLLATAGILAELIRKWHRSTGSAPWTWYLAGLIGASVALSLMLAAGAMTQYVPFMEPGLLNRLAFVVGYVLFCLPIVLLISAVFAFFSLAGGALIHRKREPENPEKERSQEKWWGW